MAYISGLVNQNCEIFVLGPDHNKITSTTVTCTSGNFSHSSEGESYYHYFIGDLSTNSGTVVSTTSSGEVDGYGSVFTVSDIDDNTKLLLHFDEDTFIDHSNSNHTITRNNGVARSSTKSKFNLYSCYFDGTDDYVSVPDSEDWNFGSGDFTIDAWINLYEVTINGHTIVSQRNDADNRLWFGYSPDLSIGLRLRVLSGGNDVVLLSQGSTAGWSADTWYHVAVVRRENVFKLYRNGVLLASTTSSNTLPNFNSTLTIGVNGSESYFKGYMDELRISKGIARWTTNFTPPTREYTKTSASSIIATGGSAITEYGGYKIHYFNNSDTFTINNLIGTPFIDYLVVGGGGGGGYAQATGGASGRIVWGTMYPTVTGTYSVTIGAGGAGGISSHQGGYTGGTSSFGSVSAAGGVGGATNGVSSPSGYCNSDIYTGGSTYGSGAMPTLCGGGGGAGTNGGNASSSAGGNGGDGYISNITFTPTYYAAGGGGGVYSNTTRPGGTGGLGGGGNGGSTSGGVPSSPTTGAANTGSGGGGGSQYTGVTNGAAGGSGIVIVRYKI